MSANDALIDIDRIHDDDPLRAAAALRDLDVQSLAADRLPTLAFLLNHLLGEKLGHWSEAAERLAALRATRGDIPLAVDLQAAVAAELSGASPASALASLVASGGQEAAEIAVALGKLAFAALADPAEMASALDHLAQRARPLSQPNPLDQRLAIGFNNATSRLLERAGASVDAPVRSALVSGSAAALQFWRRAGTWVQHERALYLQALVYNRTGAPAAARDACTEALALIEAHGEEEVDRAFLKLQLAGALLRLNEQAAGETILAEARRAAASWDDDGLRQWFAEEQARVLDNTVEQSG